jgi:uncharacterized protein YndB with AHSA1/START domain
MSSRIDKASRFIRASPATIYAAFATAEAMSAWLPPAGMTATLRDYDFREGGGYRMRLTYDDPHDNVGKTSADADGQREGACQDHSS